MAIYQVRRRFGPLFVMPHRYETLHHRTAHQRWLRDKGQARPPLPWHEPVHQQMLIQILTRYAEFKALRKRADHDTELCCQHHSTLHASAELAGTHNPIAYCSANPQPKDVTESHSRNGSASHDKLQAMHSQDRRLGELVGFHKQVVNAWPVASHILPLPLARFRTVDAAPVAAAVRQGAADMARNAWQYQTLAHSNAILHQALTEAQQQLQQLAHYVQFLEHETGYDALTNTPNRCLFNDRLEQALHHAKRHHHVLAILFIDLDRFKQINDQQGHHAGDQVLKTIAQRLLHCLRYSDSVCRYGGDEFLVLLTDMTAHTDAAQVAQTIINTLSLPITFANTTLQVGASVGIALYPQDGETAAFLIQAADSAMYSAKRAGGQTFQWASPPILPAIPFTPGRRAFEPSTLVK
jgi:diguanylate cyclase (GGDEF)-like protein